MSKSVRHVAAGVADIAAIDYVSWRYARRFVPQTAALRVLALTSPTPGLPYVAAPSANGATPAAVAAGCAALDPEARRTLGLSGFTCLSESDFDLIRQRARAIGLKACA